MSNDNSSDETTSIVQRIRTWAMRYAPDGAREGDTARGGFLSYAGEWHSLAVGLAAGFAAAATGRWELAAIPVALAFGLEAVKLPGADPSAPVVGEVRREPWYALGGDTIGVAVGLLVVGTGLALPL
ncbi:hypothetical protein BRC71_06365 [Halobacteriales archaeon QH_7_65_31]|nr:MAG: hypothetical protein BRC71_06365 [Halobacteriales archaeon QH_7_65_31]